MQESRHGDAGPEQGGEIVISPRAKDAPSRAFAASREFNHSCVGPEHLLIGLAEEGVGIAADVLRRCGITLQAFEERLHERVIGQDEVVKTVADAVRLARAGLRERRGPIGTFLFLGPTGVGKTEADRTSVELERERGAETDTERTTAAEQEVTAGGRSERGYRSW